MKLRAKIFQLTIFIFAYSNIYSSDNAKAIATFSFPDGDNITNTDTDSNTICLGLQLSEMDRVRAGNPPNFGAGAGTMTDAQAREYTRRLGSGEIGRRIAHAHGFPIHDEHTKNFTVNKTKTKSQNPFDFPAIIDGTISVVQTPDGTVAKIIPTPKPAPKPQPAVTSVNTIQQVKATPKVVPTVATAQIFTVKPTPAPGPEVPVVVKADIHTLPAPTPAVVPNPIPVAVAPNKPVVKAVPPEMPATPGPNNPTKINNPALQQAWSQFKNKSAVTKPEPTRVQRISNTASAALVTTFASPISNKIADILGGPAKKEYIFQYVQPDPPQTFTALQIRDLADDVNQISRRTTLVRLDLQDLKQSIINDPNVSQRLLQAWSNIYQNRFNIDDEAILINANYQYSLNPVNIPRIATNTENNVQQAIPAQVVSNTLAPQAPVNIISIVPQTVGQGRPAQNINNTNIERAEQKNEINVPANDLNQIEKELLNLAKIDQDEFTSKVSKSNENDVYGLMKSNLRELTFFNSENNLKNTVICSISLSYKSINVGQYSLAINSSELSKALIDLRKLNRDDLNRALPVVNNYVSSADELFNNNKIKTSSKYVSFAKSIVDVFLNINRGLLDSARSITHTILHPVETIKQISKAALILADLLAAADIDDIGATVMHAANPEVYRDRNAETIAAYADSIPINELIDGLVKKVQSASVNDIAHGAGRVAGDILIPQKALQGIAIIANLAKQELAASSLSNLTNGALKALSVEEKVKVAAQLPNVSIVVESLEVVNESRQAIANIEKSCVFFEGWCKQAEHDIATFADPLISPEAMQRRIRSLSMVHSDPSIVAKELQNMKRVNAQFRGRKIQCVGEYRGIVTINDIDHSLLFQPTIGGNKIKHFSGGHCDPNGLMEQAGLVKLFNKRQLADEIYVADVWIAGRLEKEKTIVTWSQEKYWNKVIESSKKIIRQNNKQEGSKMTEKLIGLTDDNIPFEFIINDGKITSAFIKAKELLNAKG